jgi:hypothetical protein
MRLARKLGWSALASSVVLLAGAIGSLVTGSQSGNGSGIPVSSHATAAWVLGSLAVVFLVHSLALFAWASEQLYAPAERRVPATGSD